jgi:hypothetical protein
VCLQRQTAKRSADTKKILLLFLLFFFCFWEQQEQQDDEEEEEMGDEEAVNSSWRTRGFWRCTLRRPFANTLSCWRFAESRKMQQKRVHTSACGHTHVCEEAVCVSDLVRVWCWWATRSGNSYNDLESQVKKQMYVCEHVPQAERPSDAMWEPKVSIVPHLKWMRVDKVDSVRMSAEDLSNGQKLPRWPCAFHSW